MIQPPFPDRAEAGRLLAAELARRALPENVIVLALPRGGVPVGWEVAKALRAPLDVVVVRKLGVPWQPELAMGAIAGGSVQVLDADLIAHLQVSRLVSSILRTGPLRSSEVAHLYVDSLP